MFRRPEENRKHLFFTSGWPFTQHLHSMWHLQSSLTQMQPDVLFPTFFPKPSDAMCVRFLQLFIRVVTWRGGSGCRRHSSWFLIVNDLLQSVDQTSSWELPSRFVCWGSKEGNFLHWRWLVITAVQWQKNTAILRVFQLGYYLKRAVFHSVRIHCVKCEILI